VHARILTRSLPTALRSTCRRPLRGGGGARALRSTCRRPLRGLRCSRPALGRRPGTLDGARAGVWGRVGRPQHRLRRPLRPASPASERHPGF
jgi:hypothetical protein